MTEQLIPNSDPNIAFPVPEGDVDEYFPLRNPDPSSDTFEIGLVLGGTVSSAAYTAGVLDFLIQALDAWTVGKLAHDPAAPNHKVIIKILAGTSGGGISCVLLARTIGAAFSPGNATAPAEQLALNPFYDNWVNQIDISDFLQTTDLQTGKPVHSLLCAHKLDSASDQMAQYRGAPLGQSGTPTSRNYIEPHLPVVLTLTNLRGIPYSAHFRGPSDRPEYYIDHADHMRFLVDIMGNNPPAPGTLRPYEIGISATPANGVLPWSTIIHAARGTSAFPVGLPPQTIERDPQHYRYRYAVVGSGVEWLRPAWPYIIPKGSGPNDPYQFLAVDGGCFNNEPTEFARRWLAGVQGHNDRSADHAHRAVVLVDPFADTPDVGLITDPGVLMTAGGTLSSWTSGSRFETADLDLFTSEEVFSRFLINPVRRDAARGLLAGGNAIATSCLGAFGGFLSRTFREHDFFLGRRNCQQFLRSSFTFDPQNSLFANWTAGQRAKYADKDGFLPAIPLMSSVSGEIALPPWPKDTFTPSSIRDLVESRLEKLADAAAVSITGTSGGPIAWIASLVASRLAAAGTDKVIDVITKGLQSAYLL